MTLEEFAKRAGVKIISCDPSWGGRFGYKTDDSQNCSVCGFRSERSALKGWLRDAFGAKTAKAVTKLLEVTAP